MPYKQIPIPTAIASVLRSSSGDGRQTRDSRACRRRSSSTGTRPGRSAAGHPEGWAREGSQFPLGTKAAEPGGITPPPHHQKQKTRGSPPPHHQKQKQGKGGSCDSQSPNKRAHPTNLNSGPSPGGQHDSRQRWPQDGPFTPASSSNHHLIHTRSDRCKRKVSEHNRTI